MISKLDLTDIQGNLIRAYGRSHFGCARYVFFRIGTDGGAGARAFIDAITSRITTSVTWGSGEGEVKRPDVTTNIAFTYSGLEALGLPRASLAGFPPEFAVGMRERRDILGDDGPSAPEHWDTVWQDVPVHIFISINGQTAAFLEQRYDEIIQLVNASQGAVVLVKGHGGKGGEGDSELSFQDACVVMENGKPCSKEHFGFTDAIGDPVFTGLPESDGKLPGRGKQVDGGWEALATGEFILGHLDEAREYPVAPEPFLLSRNGSFMVYRKLHQNVASFNAYLEQEGTAYPGGKELLAAKFVGRWRDNGAPLAAAPDAAAKDEWDKKYQTASEVEKDNMLSNFTFDDDPLGAKCPFSAHLRRVNPRASLQTESGAFNTPGALANRRRVLRRGLPYGAVQDPPSDKGEHGIIIMMVCASISRQFEFVQQQWINYGNDFRVGNDKDVILGNHGSREFSSKAVIQVGENSDDAPYFLRDIPRFVLTRGGDYFFMPSMTALRLIAKGLIDPT